MTSTPTHDTVAEDGHRPFGGIARALLAKAFRFLRALAGTRYGLAGLIIISALALIAVAAPWLAPYNPLRQVDTSAAPSSWQHPMGTDNIGRDLLSLVIYGTRASLAIGSCTALAALFVGGLVGITAGYWRGATEAVLMRLAELFQTLPVIIVALFAIGLFGASFWLLVGTVALAIWPLEARLIFGQFVSLREREFVAAAIVADLPYRHIILREILRPELKRIEMEHGNGLPVTDYKSALQEQAHAAGRKRIVYAVVKEEGPEHKKVFTVVDYKHNPPFSLGIDHKWLGFFQYTTGAIFANNSPSNSDWMREYGNARVFDPKAEWLLIHQDARPYGQDSVLAGVPVEEGSAGASSGGGDAGGAAAGGGGGSQPGDIKVIGPAVGGGVVVPN